MWWCLSTLIGGRLHVDTCINDRNIFSIHLWLLVSTKALPCRHFWYLWILRGPQLPTQWSDREQAAIGGLQACWFHRRSLAHYNWKKWMVPLVMVKAQWSFSSNPRTCCLFFLILKRRGVRNWWTNRNSLSLVRPCHDVEHAIKSEQFVVILRNGIAQVKDCW